MRKLIIIMFLVVGLGNPGKKFKNTRHNLGFEVINEFAQEKNFPQSKSMRKALISEGNLHGEKVILAKPQTFMNKSGQAVRSLVDYFSVPLSNLIVIHDDLDLLTGELKISEGRGSGGHNGIQSVINELQSKDFIRIRIGIGYEEGTPDQKKYVLGKFQDSERKAVEQAKQKTIEALELIIKEETEQAMNEYN